MPWCLRVIRMAKWYGGKPPWVPEGDVPAEPLADFVKNIQDNALSTFRIADDMANLDLVVAAFAASRDELANFDYTLFRDDVLTALSIAIRASPGETPDDEVNKLYHFDLVELTGCKLVGLVSEILKGGEPKRVQSGDVGNKIRQAIRTGRIPCEKLKPRLRESIRLGP